MFVSRLLPLQFAAVIILSLIAPSSFGATAEERAVFGSSLHLNFQQGLKLAAQNKRSCPHENKKLNSVKDLRVSIFYGYWNTEKLVLDGAQAAAMVAALQTPCPQNLESCGFRLIKQERFRTVLTKNVGPRKITLAIFNTSITSDGQRNKNDSLIGSVQAHQSAAIEREFNRALVTDDVVFYSGHARYGGGLGFRVDSLVEDAINIVTRAPIRTMTEALRTKPSRLKLLGLFTCESDRHYRYVVEDANPNTNLIVTHGDILNVEGDQTMLGALNSILMNRCDAEFRDSLISTVAPHSRILEYVRRPESY